MKNPFYNDDVCIVGVGCVLPEADNPQEFWKNILADKCSIRRMPRERFKPELYLSQDRNEEDKTHSNWAAFVEDSRLKRIGKKLGLGAKNNRLQIMALEAAGQALACLSGDSLKKVGNTAVFLGCMEIDESLVLEKIFLHNKELFRRHIEKNSLKDGGRILAAMKKHFLGEKETEGPAMFASVLMTSALDLIKKRFGLRGEGALIDAACASSLAALDAAIGALRSYQADLVLSGGVESNLGPDTFVLFSRVGILAKERCLPFDKNTDGLSQGEGAAVFALQRLEDALVHKNHIYGIIRSVGSASDGRSSSLFSPSLGGQLLAYERAYEKLDKTNIDYIECHGTGTRIGDALEVSSLNNFFKQEKTPIGSVKSLIGHTKGAAGAAGLLKCVLMLENKIIPSSKYIEKPITGRNSAVFVNKKRLHLKKSRALRFGISSFGFGNINYHVVLDEFKGEAVVRKGTEVKNEKIVIVGRGSAQTEINPAALAEKFKIPPQSLSAIDKIQLLALLSVSDAFEASGIRLDALDRQKVSVLSATSLGLNSALDFVERIRLFEMKEALSFLDERSLRLMLDYKNQIPGVSEDTGSGVLNNVIAGRICNTFDFKGKNFNVDSDFNSFSAALNIAVRGLSEEPGIVVLVFCEEKFDKTKTRLERKNVSCFLLSTLALAQKENYPIREIVQGINYHE